MRLKGAGKPVTLPIPTGSNRLVLRFYSLLGGYQGLVFVLPPTQYKPPSVYWFPERNPFEGVPHQIFLRTSLMLGHCNSVLTLL